MASRNASIDLLKIILAFLVIALHIFPLKKFDDFSDFVSFEIANGITRIAVPTFFIISGYFLRNKIDDVAYLKKYGIRILQLFLVWQLIYLPDLIRFYNLNRFDFQGLVLRLIYGYWHLWYLLATVGGVFLVYQTRKWSVTLKFMAAFFVFFVGYIIQLVYKLNIFEKEVFFTQFYEWIGTPRNFFFLAFPFLLLGTLYDTWKKVIQKPVYPLLIGLFLLFFESYVYYGWQLGPMDFFILIVPVSMCLFAVFETSLINSNFEIPSTLSLGVYLCHPYAIRIVNEFVSQNTIMYVFLKYILISIITVMIWFVLNQINRKMPLLF